MVHFKGSKQSVYITVMNQQFSVTAIIIISLLCMREGEGVAYKRYLVSS